MLVKPHRGQRSLECFDDEIQNINVNYLSLSYYSQARRGGHTVVTAEPSDMLGQWMEIV